VGATDPRVSVLCGIGVPAGIWDMSFLKDVSKPTLIVQGTHDAFGPQDKIEEVFDLLAGNKRIEWIQGADHSFRFHLDPLQEKVRAFLAEIV
jgi:predicted alpha/beta-hydrolase family hydrolase